MGGYDKHETGDENEDIGYANSDPTNNSGEMKSLYKYDGSYYQHVDRYSDKSNDGSTDKQKAVDIVSRIHNILRVERCQFTVVRL